MAQRKLGRTAAQRKALLRNQVTNLIWYGRIETTLARAKEVRSMAERLITLAINECDNNVEVEKTFNNDKGQTVTVTVQNDAPLVARVHAAQHVQHGRLARARRPDDDAEFALVDLEIHMIGGGDARFSRLVIFAHVLKADIRFHESTAPYLFRSCVITQIVRILNCVLIISAWFYYNGNRAKGQSTMRAGSV